MKNLIVIPFLVAAASAEAMTFDELQSAINVAEAGSTVYVTSDLTYTGTLVVGKKLTLASSADTPCVITRSSDCTAPFLSLTAADDLTLTNLIVDGNKGDSPIDGQFVKVSAGKLTLETGAVLRNYYVKNQSILVSGGTLTMEDGAVLSGFECKDWAIAVSISGGTFQMNGGLITGCIGHQKSSRDSDGTVYVIGGTFRFYGGLITGNQSAVANAGIMCYSGTMYLHGDACCTNNIGGYSNDLAFWSGGRMYLDGTYTGRMTVCPADTWHEKIEPSANASYGSVCVSDAGTLGACNIRCQEYPEFTLDGEDRVAEASVIWRKRPFVCDGLRSRADVPEALAAVTNGGTVEVQYDWDGWWTETTVRGGTNLTWRSRPGQSLTIRRYADAKYKPTFILTEGASLRVENLTFAGLPVETQNVNFFRLQEGASLTLGEGAVICDGTGDLSAVWVQKAGASLVMETGAVICNITSGWGAAVRIGEDGAAADPVPVFRMQGGVITNNAITGSTHTYQGGWGGIVCVNGCGRFEMSGGFISDNRLVDGTCDSGVFANGSNAQVVFSGDATVWGNTGAYPDAMFYKGATVEVVGDFRGRVGVCSPGVDVGTPTGITLTEGASGAWNFVSKWSGSVDAYVGQADQAGAVTFAAPIGSVGGIAVAAESDLDILMPAALDLSAGSADRARLPIVCGGKALEHDFQITVTFDSAAMKASGDLPLTVLAAESGQHFEVGHIRFTTPSDPDGGYWRVKSAAAGAEYCLRWQESAGLVLMFR